MQHKDVLRLLSQLDNEIPFIIGKALWKYGGSLIEAYRVHFDMPPDAKITTVEYMWLFSIVDAVNHGPDLIIGDR